MANLTVFELLAKYAPYQLYRYAMDWERQLIPNAPDVWEAHEPGSLKGVLRAYKHAILIIKEGQNITCDDLIDIHAFCMSFVQDAKFNFRTQYGGFKIGHGNSSEAGLRELAQKQLISKNLYRSYNESNCKGVSLVTGSEQEIFTQLQKLRKSRGFYLQAYHGDLTQEEAAEMELGKPSERLKNKYRAATIQKIKEILNNFYLKFGTLSTDDADAKLQAIVILVQDLEQAHPFFDGNCRTFCKVLLNTLLMQYDFHPTLMDNPNKFDGYSIAELVTLIKEGMDRTQQLCRYVTHNHSSPSFFSSIGGVSDTLESSNERKMLDDWINVSPDQRDKLTLLADPLITILKSAPEDGIQSSPSV